MFEQAISFALLGSLFQIGTILFTGPAQVKILHRLKEAQSHTPTYHISGGISAMFWCLHATIEVWNPALAIPTFLGMILGYTIAGQIVYYKYIAPRKNGKKVDRSLRLVA